MKKGMLCLAISISITGAATAQTSTVFKDQFKLIKAPNAIARFAVRDLTHSSRKSSGS